MINEQAIRTYVLKQFRDAAGVDIRKLGSGVQGSGFLVEMQTADGTRSYVVKSLLAEGFGHDYPSDRAAVFLLDLDEYRNLPNHVKAVDVLAEMEDGSVKSIGGGKEYYLMMEKVEGTDYFRDLEGFADRAGLEETDIAKIKAMAAYLAGIHSVKKQSKTLYWRKLRDTVGHGECLMGVFDLYPEGSVAPELMADIIRKSVDYIYRIKPLHSRLSQVHGDFHPGNIWFKEAESNEQKNRSRLGVQGSRSEAMGKALRAESKKSRAMSNTERGRAPEFVLLDRSRGPWGEPADDLTALAINYIFFSLKNHGDVRGAYLEALKLFIDEYVRLSNDPQVLKVTGPFFAFRSAVVANPLFYPDLAPEQRDRLFRFSQSVLSVDLFEADRVNRYL